MNIRTMQMQDVEQVATLEQQCFSRPWSLQSFRDVLKTPYRILFVAIEDDRIVGECMLTDIAGEGEITNVAVHNAYRGRGIAGQMMQAALKEGQKRNISAYTLEVRVGNTPAIRLYESFGFATEGVRKNFYDSPVEDALIMWKR